jgi:hypothetical protein
MGPLLRWFERTTSRIETRARHQVGLKGTIGEPSVRIVLLQIPVEVAHSEYQKQSPERASH